jgi:hypothetical protein
MTQAQMTDQEFAEAVEQLQLRGASAQLESWAARAVFEACKELMGTTPSDAELAAFLASLDQASRKQLKSLADEKLALGL